MSLRYDLAGVLARDARYSIHAYAFVFESLEFAKGQKKRAHGRARGGTRSSSRHVDGRELCDGARRVAIEQYGLMALTVLALWGVHSTSDLGEIVYNLIGSGELEKMPSDARADFDDVFDFDDAFRLGFNLALGEVA